MFNHCIILAAGKGTRLIPLTSDRPKAMVELNGEYLISKSLKQVIESIETVTITVGHKPSSLIKYALGEGVKTILNTKDKGNFWWLFNTLYRYVDEPVLLLPCDILTKINLNFLYKNYLHLGEPHCMLVPISPLENMEGDFIIGNDNLVSSFSRERNENYCSGIQVLNPYAINSVMEKKENHVDVWQALIALNELKYSETYPEDWYSINDIKQLKFYLNT